MSGYLNGHILCMCPEGFTGTFCEGKAMGIFQCIKSWWFFACIYLHCTLS